MSDSVESFQERQDNESEVLQAIFMDDFVDVNKGDHRDGMNIKLHLTPQQGMSGCGNAHVTVDMRVTCPPRYPEVLPDIVFEREKGLSTDKLKHLSKEINSMAKKLKGEVMILELAQHVQAFLHAHNVPGYKSFYEEMMSNKKKEQEKEAKEREKQQQLQRKREEKERMEIEEEILKMQSAKEEIKRRKELANKESEATDQTVPPSPEKTKEVSGRNQRDSAPNRGKRQPDPVDAGSDNSRGRVRTLSESKNTKHQSENEAPNQRHPKARRSRSDSYHRGVVTTVFNTKTERTINRGQVISYSDKGSTTYVGMDSQSGELVTLREWVMKWKHGKGRKPLPDEEQAAENCIKQLGTIEQELLSLIKLEHPNLVHYLAIKHTQGKEAVTVELLMEYTKGGSLDLQAFGGTPIPLDVLRQYASDLLEALVYLHGRGVVHKNLQASSVYVDSHGSLRLADYSLCKRLDDLNESIQAGSHNVRFSEEKSYGGRGGKKGDILKLGILLIELIQAQEGVQYPCEVPQDLPADLQDLLNRCLDTDERNRSSASSLQDHPFIKPSISVSPETNSNLPNDLNSSGNEKEADVSIPEPKSYDIHLGHSRLRSEFEVLDFLGKGGFGSVTKVLNKLDGSIYAIKRILLNPKSRELNRKITREVKLLSRLNHENVVRYFNSWIEVAESPPTTETDSDSLGTVTNTTGPIQKPTPDTRQPTSDKNSLSISDDIEKLAPKVSFSTLGSVDWSTSHDTGGLDSSSDSSSDEEDVFGASFMPCSDSSDGIEFEHNNSSPDISDSKSKQEEGKKPTDANLPPQDVEPSRPLQYLYIQMEFCEKSTLRTAIDQGLYLDERRVWRYLREIVEGLAHIHSQGMIHRDLKPVNIFLDSNDLVKIGDFGLATAGNMGTAALPDIPQGDLHEAQLLEGSAGTGSHLTGKVGTALYVSPELCQAKSSHYNQKVDLYSLGIIFFEMCNPPLATGMERVQMLGRVREENIHFPDTFDEFKHENEAFILRWLLNHDPEARPTAQELLQSKHLPPPQMEDARLQEMLRHTISNSQSKAYRHIIQELFHQTVPAPADFTYDMDMHKGFSFKSSVVQQAVYETLCRIFQKHSALRVNTPLLLPRNKQLERSEMCVNLMTHSGGLVSLAYDLRIPFARFVARNNVTNLKRYCIERVYRERQIYGCHPRELTECAFDIVTSSSVGLIPDAEILHIVSEIINEFPALQARNYSIRLNHTSLLTAVLNHCGIPGDKHHEVYKILSDARTEKLTKLQIQTRLCSMSLSEQQVRNLYSYIELEGHHSKVAGALKSLVNCKGPSGSMVKQGLHELEAIISQAQVFGIRLEMIVTLSLVYNIHCFSGVIFQFVAESVHRKKKTGMDVLAAGGRYDQLIQIFKKPSSQQHQVCPSAVGISVSFEKIVSAVLQDTYMYSLSETTPSVCDVLVCAIGSSSSYKDKIKVVRDLWASGLRADILYDSTMPLEEIQDYCRAVSISYLVVLKDRNETVKIRFFDKEKQVTEYRADFHNVVETLHQMISTSKTETLEGVQQTTIKLAMLETMPTSNATNYNVTFVPRPEISARKKHERVVRIQSKIEPVLECITSKTKVEVVAVDLPLAVVKSMVAVLDFDGESNYSSSVSTLRDMHIKYKKVLDEICYVLQKFKLDNGVSFVILYTYKEDAFKVIY
ncbi:eIF-2-alpha kinase GCN2-like isoform X2 [Patiria miniata]|uniref:non-specific serine/threonine protein kinase n=1 Tax=Patiria miniata TaxID=46514 RepID=A0A914BA29_PATMI|nr:eIF-2-alpha kinase GCN2-like isoform X2 [Patiria miniata]